MSYNVHFIGRVGTDAEVVTTGSTQFISFRVAVDESNGKDKATRWVSVMADSNRYKNIAQYLKKGKLLLISGSDRVTAYTSKNGELGVDTRVWVDKIDFIPLGQKQENGAEQPSSTDEKNAKMTTGTIKVKSSAQPTSPMPETSFVEHDTNDDDLPF